MFKKACLISNAGYQVRGVTMNVLKRKGKYLFIEIILICTFSLNSYAFEPKGYLAIGIDLEGAFSKDNSNIGTYVNSQFGVAGVLWLYLNLDLGVNTPNSSFKAKGGIGIGLLYVAFEIGGIGKFPFKKNEDSDIDSYGYYFGFNGIIPLTDRHKKITVLFISLGGNIYYKKDYVLREFYMRLGLKFLFF